MRIIGCVLGGVAFLALGGCVASSEEEQLSQSSTDGRYQHWRIERARRQAELNDYNAAHADEYASFKNAALGTSGIPMIMLRLFPEMFPEIWGGPSENFARVGFTEDTLEPGRVLPLGLGYAATATIPTQAGPVDLNIAQLTCAGCHTGRVVDGSGTVQQLIGAPSTQFTRFRTLVYVTVNDGRYSAAAFKTAINNKPPGWVYGKYDAASVQKEMLERAVFNQLADSIVGNLRAGSIAGAQRFAATLGTYTYGPVPNAPNPSGSTPGYLDAIGAGITIVVDPTQLSPAQVQAAVPPKPAMIDIMSVWNQKDRPAAQWDGSIPSKLHRNLAAELGVVGNPTKLNMDNVNKTTAYTEMLPSNPYPFDIDTASASRGEELFVEYCASCHTPGNTAIFSPAIVGTDANRAIIWTPYSIAGLIGALRLGCTDTVTCNNPDGSPVASADIIHSTGGYMALPLDGIWARAPYLHNGSVPSMYALLTGDRPTKFQRGNINYDQARMGFVETAGPFTAEYDTTLSGNSNVGHNTPAFNGDVDWAHEPKKLNDLLSYLKTL
jgi:hypothetical protein